MKNRVLRLNLFLQHKLCFSIGLISLDTKENKTLFCILIMFKASEIDASVLWWCTLVLPITLYVRKLYSGGVLLYYLPRFMPGSCTLVVYSCTTYHTLCLEAVLWWCTLVLPITLYVRKLYSAVYSCTTYHTLLQEPVLWWWTLVQPITLYGRKLYSGVGLLYYLSHSMSGSCTLVV